MDARDPAPAAAARPVPRRRPRPLGRGRGAGAARARGGGDRASTRARVPEEAAERLRAAGRGGARAGADGVELLDGAGSVIKSPGVPQEAPVIAAARERGIPVLGEFELGWRLLAGHEFVAVTGSNGKTTTVELIGHLHREAGLPVKVAGNVGTALTSLPGHARARHDDRRGGVLVPARGHGGVRARGRRPAQPRRGPPGPPRHLRGLPRRQARGLRPPAERGGRRRAARPRRRGPRRLRPARVLRRRPGRGARRPRRAAVVGRAAAAGRLRARAARRPQRAERDGRRGRVRSRAGSTPTRSRAGLRSFGGLAHRLEEVATVDGVLYVNDSKATNVASALVGIDSFPGGVHVDPRRPQQGRRLHRARARPSPSAAAPRT